MVAFSRHKKGSSGAGGVWALRAPIHKRAQRPNLHSFKGQKYCTKCLRIVKKENRPFFVPARETSDKAVAATDSMV